MDKIIIRIGEIDYNIGFPTVGQMLEIESIKMAFTNGKYVDYAMSLLRNHTYLLDVADAIAYFSVLAPQLKINMKIDNWRDVPPQQMKILVVAYRDSFIPWYKPLIEDLYSYDKKEQIENGKQAEENS